MAYFSLFAVFVFLIFIYSPQLHSSREEEGETISTTNIGDKTLLLSDKSIFFLFV